MRVGIAGAGVMGLLLAHSLVKMKCDVTLYDMGEENNCSNAAAGLLTPIAELEKSDELIFRLGMESLKIHWPAILNELGNDIYFRHAGSLLLAHSRDRAELANFMSRIPSHLYEAIEHEHIVNLEPDLSGFNSGYYLADEGQLDNQTILKRLKENLLAKGVKFKTEKIQEVEPGKIDAFKHDLVCDCRGLGAGNQLINLRSVRGELIWLWAPDVTITRPVRLLHPRYKLYLVPRPGNIYLIGATEIESNDLSDISVRSALELLTAVYYINPKFAEARIIKTVTQCRPTFSDNRPKIHYADGYVSVNGLYRHGFLIAPSLAQEITNQITRSSFSRLSGEGARRADEEKTTC